MGWILSQNTLPTGIYTFLFNLSNIYEVENMFEYMLQGIALAGGVSVPPGRTILPSVDPQPRGPGMLRRGFGQGLGFLSRQFKMWSEKLLKKDSAAALNHCNA